jgi:signal transduction histidine kinase
MRDRKRYFVIAIVASTLLITYLHYSVFQRRSYPYVLEELYYIPLFLGALTFGLKGNLLTYLFVSAFYLPNFFGNMSMTFFDLVDRLLHLLFSGIFAILAGFLMDRERKHQRQSERDRYLAGIGQMTATIIHDLKNPLITILGFANRIKSGKTNMDTAIERIIDSAGNIEKIVNGALDFTKPVQLNLKTEDITHVVRLACESCRTKAEERGITLSFDNPSQPVHAFIDSFNIQRALTNLIANAIEASDNGKQVITSVAYGAKHVIIKVKDFGAGMDEETLENIFIPFYSKKNTGTGLGMTIAKKIVEGHKGEIHVKSRPGLGTEVIIKLSHPPQ